MTSFTKIIKMGTRSSNLALLQTKEVMKRLSELLPAVTFTIVPMSSPGDEDRKTPLEHSATDFFTQYLDHAIRDGVIDCAIHSAKDLPETKPQELDWFWLPWKEDPRDVIVLREHTDLQALPENGIIGISSARRREYAMKRFPKLVCKSIRGNIEDRLSQLDNGDYDLLIMAGAALKRLQLEHRIYRWISMSELPSPEGQGILAVTYRLNDHRLNRIRNLFLKPAVFVGAGAGNPDYCTLAGVRALQEGDVCLFDALAPQGLLKKWCNGIQLIDVGKRSGKYKISRESLDTMLIDFVRQGKRVVRLKGGDPGIFGRLAEELAPFVEHEIPFRVVPGVSSINAATTGSGILLTRRGVSRGFSVITPRLADGKLNAVSAKARTKLPIVFFMAVGKIKEIVEQLISEGRSMKEPATMVFGGGMTEEKIVSGNLQNIRKKIDALATELPGLLMVGEIADASYLYKNYGPLAKTRILITASEELQDSAEKEVLDFGGIPIRFPLITLKPIHASKSDLVNVHHYDWVILTSPSAVRWFVTFIRELRIDFRTLPKFLVSGPGVSRVLWEHGIVADGVPSKNFGSASMIELAKEILNPNDRVLRCRSTLASQVVRDELEKQGIQVTDCILYENISNKHSHLPEFDAAVFASGSAFHTFVEQWSPSELKDKVSIAIGRPTLEAMESRGFSPSILAREPSMKDCIKTYAQYRVNDFFKSNHERTL